MDRSQLRARTIVVGQSFPMCNLVNNADTLILPDPKKQFFWEHFWIPLWTAAAERLRAAREVFIHGYSMPAADGKVRELLFDNINRDATINVHCRSTSDRIAR